LHVLEDKKPTFQGCLVAPKNAIFILAASIRFGGAVLMYSARPLDLFENLAGMLLCLCGDVWIMKGSLVNATGTQMLGMM